MPVFGRRKRNETQHSSNSANINSNSQNIYIGQPTSDTLYGQQSFASSTEIPVKGKLPKSKSKLKLKQNINKENNNNNDFADFKNTQEFPPFVDINLDRGFTVPKNMLYSSSNPSCSSFPLSSNDEKNLNDNTRLNEFEFPNKSNQLSQIENQIENHFPQVLSSISQSANIQSQQQQKSFDETHSSINRQYHHHHHHHHHQNNQNEHNILPLNIPFLENHTRRRQSSTPPPLSSTINSDISSNFSSDIQTSKTTEETSNLNTDKTLENESNNSRLFRSYSDISLVQSDKISMRKLQDGSSPTNTSTKSPLQDEITSSRFSSLTPDLAKNSFPSPTSKTFFNSNFNSLPKNQTRNFSSTSTNTNESSSFVPSWRFTKLISSKLGNTSNEKEKEKEKEKIKPLVLNNNFANQDTSNTNLDSTDTEHRNHHLNDNILQKFNPFNSNEESKSELTQESIVQSLQNSNNEKNNECSANTLNDSTLKSNHSTNNVPIFLQNDKSHLSNKKSKIFSISSGSSFGSFFGLTRKHSNSGNENASLASPFQYNNSNISTNSVNSSDINNSKIASTSAINNLNMSSNKSSMERNQNADSSVNSTKSFTNNKPKINIETLPTPPAISSSLPRSSIESNYSIHSQNNDKKTKELNYTTDLLIPKPFVSSPGSNKGFRRNSNDLKPSELGNTTPLSATDISDKSASNHSVEYFSVKNETSQDESTIPNSGNSLSNSVDFSIPTSISPPPPPPPPPPLPTNLNESKPSGGYMRRLRVKASQMFSLERSSDSNLTANNHSVSSTESLNNSSAVSSDRSSAEQQRQGDKSLSGNLYGISGNEPNSFFLPGMSLKSSSRLASSLNNGVVRTRSNSTGSVMRSNVNSGSATIRLSNLSGSTLFNNNSSNNNSSNNSPGLISRVPSNESKPNGLKLNSPKGGTFSNTAESFNFSLSLPEFPRRGRSSTLSVLESRENNSLDLSGSRRSTPSSVSGVPVATSSNLQNNSSSDQSKPSGSLRPRMFRNGSDNGSNELLSSFGLPTPFSRKTNSTITTTGSQSFLGNEIPFIPHPPDREDDESVEAYVERLQSLSKSSLIPSILCQSNSTFLFDCLLHFMKKYDFSDEPIDMALRKFLMFSFLPLETQQIDRIINGFSLRYCQCNPDIFASADQAYVIAFSLMILHTDAFNKNNKHKMVKSEYVRNSSIEGIPEQVLECFYDNITYTPFIHTEDDFDIEDFGSGKSASAAHLAKFKKNSSSFVRSSKDMIDPYMLIIEGKLDTLRPNLDNIFGLKDPYTYIFQSNKKILNVKKIHRSFVNGYALQIISRRSRPGAFMSEDTTAKPFESSPGIVQLQVLKIGIIRRHEARRLTSSRMYWRQFGAILTSSQLYLFKDIEWVKGLMNQMKPKRSLRLSRKSSDGKFNNLLHKNNEIEEEIDSNKERRFFEPPLEGFHADYSYSTENMIAITNTENKGPKNVFMLVTRGGIQDYIMTTSHEELCDWILYINYIALIRTLGLSFEDSMHVHKYHVAAIHQKEAKLKSRKISLLKKNRDTKMERERKVSTSMTNFNSSIDTAFNIGEEKDNKTSATVNSSTTDGSLGFKSPNDEKSTSGESELITPTGSNYSTTYGNKNESGNESGEENKNKNKNGIINGNVDEIENQDSRCQTITNSFDLKGDIIGSPSQASVVSNSTASVSLNDSLNSNFQVTPAVLKALAEDKILESQRYIIQCKKKDLYEKLKLKNEEIESLKKISKHLRILTPIQQKTREAIMYSAASFSAKIDWLWVERIRFECYLNIIERELESERLDPESFRNGLFMLSPVQSSATVSSNASISSISPKGALIKNSESSNSSLPASLDLANSKSFKPGLSSTSITTPDRRQPFIEKNVTPTISESSIEEFSTPSQTIARFPGSNSSLTLDKIGKITGVLDNEVSLNNSKKQLTADDASYKNTLDEEGFNGVLEVKASPNWLVESEDKDTERFENGSGNEKQDASNGNNDNGLKTAAEEDIEEDTPKAANVNKKNVSVIKTDNQTKSNDSVQYLSHIDENKKSHSTKNKESESLIRRNTGSDNKFTLRGKKFSLVEVNPDLISPIQHDYAMSQFNEYSRRTRSISPSKNIHRDTEIDDKIERQELNSPFPILRRHKSNVK